MPKVDISVIGRLACRDCPSSYIERGGKREFLFCKAIKAGAVQDLCIASMPVLVDMTGTIYKNAKIENGRPKKCPKKGEL